jgi:hypothetical protein
MPIRLMLAGFLALSVTTVSAQNWPYFAQPTISQPDAYNRRHYIGPGTPFKLS